MDDYGKYMASFSRILARWPNMDCCSDGLVEGVRALTQRPGLAFCPKAIISPGIHVSMLAAEEVSGHI